MTAMNPGPGPADQTRPAPTTGAVGGLVPILGLTVLGTGVVAALLGFANFYTGGGSFYSVINAPVPIGLALFAGLVAALALLPKQAAQPGVAAAASVAGFVVVLFQVVGKGAGYSLAFGAYAILLLLLVQAAAAVFALLVDAGIVSAPAPKPAQQGGFGQPGQFGPPGQYGQPGPYGQPGGPPPFGGPQGRPSGPSPFGGPQGAPPQYGPPSQPGAQGQPAPSYAGPQGGASPWTTGQQGYGNQGYGNQGSGNQGSGTQGSGTQGSGNQGPEGQGRPEQGRPEQDHEDQPTPQQAPGASSYGPPTQAFGAPPRDADGQPENPYGTPRP